MSTANHTHDSKHHTASNWSVLRSKAIPSSVSGMHKAATSGLDTPVRDASDARVQISDETLTIKARKSPAFYDSAELPVAKP